MTRDAELRPAPGPDLVPARPDAWPADATVELCLAADDLAALARIPDLVRAAPGRAAAIVWYDDAEASLARERLSLHRDGPGWTLQRLQPGRGPEGRRADWPACTPAPIVDQAPAAADLQPPPPFDAAPVAAFEGRRRTYRLGPVGVELLHGALRGVVDTRAACRLRLSGPPDALATATPMLSNLRLSVPRASLAQEALSVAKGQATPARHLGAPGVEAGVTVSDGLARICSHLLDVLLHWVDEYRSDARPEAVHQARVATRRLRSALSLYKRVAPAPELLEAGLALKSCAERLGAVRDWDVFLAGAGDRLGRATEGDARIASLLRAARRQQKLAHAELAAYLAGPVFRGLELQLGLAAALRPWEREGNVASLRAPTAAYAGEVLARRFKHVRQRGKRLDSLPVLELHELRKDCKRLRYAAEFFVPAFPAKAVKPFISRLTALQEELGALNDASVVVALMKQLGRAGRGYAGGVVEGWAGAAAAPARARIAAQWKRFRTVEPFWTA